LVGSPEVVSEWAFQGVVVLPEGFGVAVLLKEVVGRVRSKWFVYYSEFHEWDNSM
jgi:hypothetical protein